MKTQYQQNKISAVLAVRPNTTGDTTAIQKTIDNCAAKAVYFNTIELDGIDTPVVSIETSKGSDTFAHIALDTFILTSVSKMYPRDAVIGGRIPVDGTMLNGVIDSRAAVIRQILNGVETTQQAKPVQIVQQSSDSLFKASVLQAIEDRLSDIKAFYLASLDSLLANPAQYLADNATKLDKIGDIKLTEFSTPFDLPVDRINSLLQSEKYAAQLEQFKDELICNKTSNFKVHETFLVCDGMPTPEQKTALEQKGYVLVAKDTTTLQADIAECMAKQDFASVVTLSQDLLTLQNTVEIRKALAE